MCAMQTNTRMRSTKNTLPVVKDFLLADGYHAQNLLQLYKKSRYISSTSTPRQGWMDIQPKWMNRVTMMFLIMSCWMLA